MNVAGQNGYAIGQNSAEDFRIYDTNSDGKLGTHEIRMYLHERHQALGQGKVDRKEAGYIDNLIRNLSKDGILDQSDFDLVTDTLWQAEQHTIGRKKGGKLPDMTPQKNWSEVPIQEFLNQSIPLKAAKDYLKFQLVGKNGVSDKEKLYLFNRLEEIKDRNGNVEGTALINLVNSYIPLLNTKDVFK